ncbi:MAG TPA: galactose-1-phosphate uridylyltransferase [Candidatus Binatia bacterium]|nr:galactose-1-phosphate uridylyltransferase [Candidatus Binatia bacterium]
MSELRRDPILRRWVIIAPERPGDLAQRRGGSSAEGPRDCPFCPGNEHRNPVEIARAEGPGGWAVRVTPDRHPLLRIEGELARRGAGMSDLMNAVGAHELVTDSPDHVQTWAEFEPEQMLRLLRIYRDRLADLRRDPRFRYVLVLKNRGAVWSRYQHAHSHVIATPFTPKRIEEELAGAREYHRRKERCVFCDQLSEVLGTGDRVVAQRGDLVSFTPFASAHPYETWISSVTHAADFGATPDDALEPLAVLLIDTLARLRAVCGDPAYSVALHSGAVDGSDTAEFHWHWEIVPHLGHELGMEWATGIYSNPVAPEDAARTMRGAAT